MVAIAVAPKVASSGLSAVRLGRNDRQPKLTRAQIEVKAVARQVLGKLHELVDAVNWIGNQQTRGAVWTAIRQLLNELPEDPYPESLWNAKVDQVWEFVLQRYASGSRAAH